MRTLARGALLAATLLAGTAAAHWPRPEDVVAHVGRAGGVVEARRDTAVPRLLLVRVGPPWHALPAAERQTLAETWRREWREAVPQGLVGVVDAESGAAVVNFDAQGRARLAPPPPSPADQSAPSMNSLKP